jgi:predicted MFS family arabinose efflux permease
VGAAVLGLAILLVISALQRGRDVGWGSATIVGSLLAGAALAVAFVIIELRREQPMAHVRLLGNRMYAAGNLATLLSTIGLFGFLFFFNVYAQSEATFAYSAVAASLVLLPYGLSLFVTSLVAGRLGDRIGYAIPVGGGLALLAVGAALFATIDDVTALRDLWLPLVLCGIGLGGCFATASAAPMSVVPPEQSGEAAGTINVSRYIGGALGVAVGGALFVGRGVDAMNAALADAGVTGVEEDRLDAALTGSPAGLEAAIDAAGGEARRALVADAARTGIEAGFAAACAMIAVAAALGTVIAFWGLRRPRGVG